MRYRVDSVEVNNYRDELIRKINQFDIELKRLMNSSKKLEWDSAAYYKTINLFYERVSNLKRVAEMLDLLSDFLLLTTNNYEEGVAEIRKNFQAILNQIKNEDWRGRL